MLKLNELPSSFASSYLIGQNTSHTPVKAFMQRTNLNHVILRNDLEYIPVSSLFYGKRLPNIESSANDVLASIKNHTGGETYFNSLSDNSKMELLSKIIDLYEIACEGLFNDYHNTIINKTGGEQIQYRGSSLGLTSFFTTDLFDKVVILNKNALVSPFFYAEDGKIIFTLVVKKDKIKEVKKSIHLKGEIDPSFCEIWIDEDYIDSPSSYARSFDTWLRKTLTIKLTFQGFAIRKKKNILEEIAFRPNIKINRLGQLNDIRKNINNFLLST